MDFSSYLKLETLASRRLRSLWQKKSLGLFASITRLLRQKKYQEAYKLAEEFSLADIAKGSSVALQAAYSMAVTFGGSIASGARNPMSEKMGGAGIVEKAAKQTVAMVSVAGTDILRDRILQLIADAEYEDQHAEKAEKKPKRYVGEFTSFKEDGDEVLQMLSYLNTSRLAVWGFTAEAEILGITTYKLSNFMDSKTSDFCRMIHGKVFEVAAARSKIEQVLDVEDVEQLRTVQPWPKQDKASIAAYSKMNSKELTALGLHIPPFHPGCRTLCVPVDFRVSAAGRSTTESPVGIGAAKKPEPVKIEEFEQIGLKVTEREAEEWSAIVSPSVVAPIIALTGATPEFLLEQTKNWLKFRYLDGKKIKINSKVPYSEGAIHTRLTLDGQNGSLILERMDFPGVPDEKVASYLTEFYKATSTVVYESPNLDRIVVSLGAGEAYTHLALGFVPTKSSWNALREKWSKPELLASLGLPEKKIAEVQAHLKATDPTAIRRLDSYKIRGTGKTLAQTILEEEELSMFFQPSDAIAMELLAG